MGEGVRSESSRGRATLTVAALVGLWYNRVSPQTIAIYMTPDEFRHRVLPTVLASWERGCFCRTPGFLKLVSFKFEDYGVAPMAVVDSEILIAEIIGKRFPREGQLTYGVAERVQAYRCPQCNARCQATYEDYSISMYRSFVLFENAPRRRPRASTLSAYTVPTWLLFPKSTISDWRWMRLSSYPH